MEKSAMRLICASAILLLLVKASPVRAQGAPSPEQLIQEAAAVITHLSNTKEGGFPPYVFNVLRGMAIIPGVRPQNLNEGSAKGVMLTHDKMSGWSYPAFVLFSADNLPDVLQGQAGSATGTLPDIIVFFISPSSTFWLSNKTVHIDAKRQDAALFFEKSRAAFKNEAPIYEPEFAAFVGTRDGKYTAIDLNDGVLKLDGADTKAYYGPYNRVEIPPLSILTGNERVVAPEGGLALTKMLQALTPTSMLVE